MKSSASSPISILFRWLSLTFIDLSSYVIMCFYRFFSSSYRFKSCTSWRVASKLLKLEDRSPLSFCASNLLGTCCFYSSLISSSLNESFLNWEGLESGTTTGLSLIKPSSSLESENSLVRVWFLKALAKLILDLLIAKFDCFAFYIAVESIINLPYPTGSSSFITCSGYLLYWSV